MPKPRRWTLVRVLLTFLNLMATFVTLFTGFRENYVVSTALGRYDALRQRLRSGSINTNNFESDQFFPQSIPTMEQLADYHIITTPERSIRTFNENGSVCSRVNTNSAPVMLSKYDDFWGKTARRVQTYANSISAPNCNVLNVKPAWHAQCIAERQGNATLCHELILDNFEKLQKNRDIRRLAVKDLGVSGTLFLRCPVRPLEPFAFKADRLAYQAYWNGGEYHVTLQTSECRSIPLVQSADKQRTLFLGHDIGDAATMIALLPPPGWFSFIVPWIHAMLMILLVVHGMLLAIFHTNVTSYLPEGVRYKGSSKWTRYLLPFMEMVTRLSDDARAIITFKGSLIGASDFWMTHWLYMWLSVLDAAVNIRATYLVFQISQSLLVTRVTFESMIFLMLAMTKITWLTCLVQTFVRFMLKALARGLRSARLIKSVTRENWEWHIDGLFMFLSYRISFFFFFIFMLVLLQIKGDTSFMVREVPYKVGAYGGPVDIADFWGSEVGCDLVTLITLITGLSLLFGIFMMTTKYKYVANNGMMRFLQQRYFLTGWDGLMMADLLGLDPYAKDVVVEDHAFTQTSLGSLLQVLYLAGPSGFVHLAGDYIFHNNGFSKDPVRFAYPMPKAMSMGLFQAGKGSQASSTTNPTNLETGLSLKYVVQSQVVQPTRAKEHPAPSLATTAAGLTKNTTANTTKRSIFERRLRLVTDGYVGKLLLIDANEPGQVTANKETGQREYEVVDALTTMSILDIKFLMGREKKIHIQ